MESSSVLPCWVRMRSALAYVCTGSAMLTIICGAGPAVHLVNLIPPAASLLTPSTTIVHDILTRANLPLEAVALAVCVLDSLDTKFSRNWRLACPLTPRRSSPTYTKRHTIPSLTLMNDRPHIDLIRPELIILASLVIAVKFLEDCQTSTKHFASCWGKDIWTCEQVNVTEQCIMGSLGYRILPLWDPELIGDALEDMRRAGKQASLSGFSPVDRDDSHKRSMSYGEAAACLELQFSPSGTANLEDTISWPVADVVCDHAGAAFMGGPTLSAVDSLWFPSEAERNDSSLAGVGL